ncbi:MAG: MFS transporter [Candidatus Heimdallarchaeaceae archaeon]
MEKDSDIKQEGENQEAPTKKKRSLDVLKNWNFTALFLGGFINNIGSYFTSIAIIFLAIVFTQHLPEGEATREIALMSTFTIAPMILLGPIAGVLVDKFDRKKVLVISDSLGSLLSVSLIFASQIWHLYIFAILNSSVRQFFYPAKTASIPKIVKQEQLLTANGFIQTSFNLSRLIGPLIAGFVIGIFGFNTAFIIDGISYATSAVLISTIRKSLKPVKNEEKLTLKSVASGLKEGFNLSFKDRIISFILVLFSFTIFLIGMIDPLIVQYMNFEFGMGEEDFGMIMSFSAVSGIIAAIALSIKGKLKNKLTFMSATILIASFCLAFIALAPFLPGGGIWLYVGFALVGMINVGFNIPFSTLLQSIVENKHLGKISGVIDFVINFASFLAATIAATLAGVLSISYIFLIVTVLVAIGGSAGLIVIKVKNLEEEAHTREEKMKLLLLQDKKRESASTAVPEQDSETILKNKEIKELPGSP